MLKKACHELKRLPKITGSLKSINFRRTTPGSLATVLYSNRPPSPNHVLDRTHPALGYTRQVYAHVFPWRTYPGFTVRALPKALLAKPSYRFADPPYTLNEGPMKGRSANMSLLDCASKSVGGRVIRQEILRKFKTAISLIVVRGADVVGQGDDAKIVFREEDAGKAEDWILSDWTYIIRPGLELYRTPYSAFIPSLRRALQAIVSQGRRLESEWAQLAMEQRDQTSARPAHPMSQTRCEPFNAGDEESEPSLSRPRPPTTSQLPAGDRVPSYKPRRSGVLPRYP
ncbi:hypothetical protein GY45DRAFT_1321271 [Cubamyces sp. BRFM 1775]|nr:hypothetical protein GY45DRAFT_1321271 [Cubamyces sp. BRFM 1775]